VDFEEKLKKGLAVTVATGVFGAIALFLMNAALVPANFITWLIAVMLASTILADE